MKRSIYEVITNQIVRAIEEGAATYQMPWHRVSADITCPINVVSGRGYRGLNVISLWMIAQANCFQSGTWATYQQWQEKGAQVRKGEKSATVFSWKKLERDQDGELDFGTGDRGQHFVAKAYHVFNAEQVDRYEPQNVPQLSEEARDEAAERFFRSIPANVSEGGDVACYEPGADIVCMVPFGQFKEAAGYYAVLAHELTNWTGAKSRLDRDLSGRFGSEAYAMEELVAELGAAFVARQLGLPSDPRIDHAPYIANWLKVLKNDSRAIFAAAGKAHAAADYLAAFSAAESEPG